MRLRSHCASKHAAASVVGCGCTFRSASALALRLSWLLAYKAAQQPPAATAHNRYWIYKQSVSLQTPEVASQPSLYDDIPWAEMRAAASAGKAAPAPASSG